WWNLADTRALGARARKSVRVRVPPPARFPTVHKRSSELVLSFASRLKNRPVDTFWTHFVPASTARANFPPPHRGRRQTDPRRCPTSSSPTYVRASVAAPAR